MKEEIENSKHNENIEDLKALSEADLKEIFSKMSLAEINEFIKKVEEIKKGIENNG